MQLAEVIEISQQQPVTDNPHIARLFCSITMFTPKGICIELAMSVYAHLKNDLPNLDSWVTMEEASDLDCNLTMFLGEKGPPAFGRIEIDCFADDEEEPDNRLIEVFVRSEYSEPDFDAEKVRIEPILKQYAKLKPVMTTGTEHRLGDVKAGEPEVIVERTFEVSIRAYSDMINVGSLERGESIKIKEKIARDTLQRVVALKEIYDNIRPLENK